MLRIAICEDEEKYLELEKNIVSAYLKQKGLSYDVKGFSSCESLLEDKVQLEMFDLIILDVEMKGIDGISAAKIIREKNDEVQIAFISAHMNYSTDGYHVRAIRYILKNKDDLEKYLQECLDRVLETIDQSERELTFDFTIGKRTLKVSDVVYLRSSGNYTVFEVSFESKETYLLRSTLKKMTELMHAFDFVSVSSKETVNLCHIKSMSRYSIVLDNGKVISISQKKYMTENILGIILSLLYTLMNYAFLRSVLKRKADKSIDYILIFSLFIVSALASILLRPVPIVKMVLVIVATIVVTNVVFKISIKKSIIINLIYSGVYTSIEMIALLILQKVISTNEISEITDENGAFIAELICQFAVLIIIIILSVIFKKNTLSNLDFKGWLIFALFPLFTLATIIILIYGAENQQIGDMFYKLVFFAAGLLSLNLLLFLLLDNVIRREGKIREKEMLIEQSVHLNQMYRSLSEEREKQKARSHDYLNHLQVILMLAHEGKISEEIQYVEEQIGQELQSVDIIDTGNTLINAVLNIKYIEAKEKGIVIPFIADKLTGLDISDSDLVTILTNILDNAIEAVQLCEDKKIIFKIIKDKDMLIIDSSNPYVGQISDGKTIKTSKQDKDNHGYGIANIRQTVESNNGNCFIETQDGIFHITIAIPLA